MKHYLLTRYNTQLYSGKGFNDKHGNHINSYADTWMVHRYNLFENICLPSITNQKNQNFEWLVFVDPETPEVFLNQLNKLRAKRDFLVLEGTIEARKESLEYIKKNNGDNVCVTTRIDNDDAIRYDFIESIQNIYADNIGNAIVFPKGMYFDVESKKQSSYVYLRNPFLSLIKPSNDINDVWSVEHGSIDEIANNVVEIDCEPMWLSTVHKYNRKNNLRGNIVNKDLRWVEFNFSTRIDDL